MSPDLAHYLAGVRRCYEKAHERLTAQDFEAFLIEANLIRCNFERLAEPLPPLTPERARELLAQMRAKKAACPRCGGYGHHHRNDSLAASEVAPGMVCKRCHGCGTATSPDAVTIMTSGGQVEVVRAGDAPQF